MNCLPCLAYDRVTHNLKGNIGSIKFVHFSLFLALPCTLLLVCHGLQQLMRGSPPPQSPSKFPLALPSTSPSAFPGLFLHPLNPLSSLHQIPIQHHSANLHWSLLASCCLWAPVHHPWNPTQQSPSKSTSAFSSSSLLLSCRLLPSTSYLPTKWSELGVAESNDIVNAYKLSFLTWKNVTGPPIFFWYPIMIL